MKNLGGHTRVSLKDSGVAAGETTPQRRGVQGDRQGLPLTHQRSSTVTGCLTLSPTKASSQHCDRGSGFPYGHQCSF